MFPKQRNNLRLVTNNNFILEHYPIEKYIKHIPKWFKEIPIFQNESYFAPKTAKACEGFTDYFSQSYLVRWNSDLIIDVIDRQKFEYYPDTVNENTYDYISWFSNEMYGDYAPAKDKRTLDTIIKIETHWQFVADKDSRVLFLSPYFEYNDEVKVVQGIVNAKYFPRVNVLLELYTKQYKIERGAPACLLIPLDNQKIEVDMMNDKDKKHLDRLSYLYDTSIYNSYHKAKRDYNV
tara:strand:+ start:666 stop:1370 length:705 start_codon:yes stop_codon:yes gene_type:complete